MTYGQSAPAVARGKSRLVRIALFCSNKIPGWRFFRMLQYIWAPMGLVKFQLAYRRALRKGDVRLHIGAGYNHINGWLNTDISPLAPLFLDASRSFPIADKSVLYIFCEHFIEHIPRNKAALFLRESFRVLKPGGKIRISTPDLEAYAREYLNRSEYAHLLMQHYNENRGSPYVFYCADLVYDVAQVHRCLYDSEILRQMLESAGFECIKRCSVGISQDVALSRIEQHGVGTIEEMFTLVMEGTKPLP